MKTLSIPLIIFLFICLFKVESKAQHIRKYQAGCYYDTAGIKHTGLIDFGVGVAVSTYNKLNFKTNDSASNQKIPISVIKSVIIQGASRRDTIFVYTEMDTTRFERTQYFGQLCISTPNMRIYSRQLLKSQNNGAWSMGTPGYNMKTPGGTVHIAGAPSTYFGSYGSSEYSVTQYMYEIDGSLTVPIYRSNYKEVLSKAFADDPELVAKIKNKSLKFGDIEEIMSLYQDHKNRTTNQ
jgi:hypothetical protein